MGGWKIERLSMDQRHLKITHRKQKHKEKQGRHIQGNVFFGKAKGKKGKIQNCKTLKKFSALYRYTIEETLPGTTFIAC